MHICSGFNQRTGGNLDLMSCLGKSWALQALASSLANFTNVVLGLKCIHPTKQYDSLHKVRPLLHLISLP